MKSLLFISIFLAALSVSSASTIAVDANSQRVFKCRPRLGVSRPPTIPPPNGPAAPPTGAPITAPPPTTAPPTAPPSGNLPVGELITECKVANTVALTFDDGPTALTKQLLDTMANFNREGIPVKATFFVLGERLSFDDTQAVVRARNEGHLIASHSWDHTDFRTLNRQQTIDQMTRTETEFKRVLGVRPRYMRLPYGEFSQSVTMPVLKELGYNVIQWGEANDSNDWQTLNVAATIQFYSDMVKRDRSRGFLTLNHDTHQETVEAMKTVIRNIHNAGLKMVTVAECMGETTASAYRA